jgi:uncharacterized SAM-dependent methyltransferase
VSEKSVRNWIQAAQDNKLDLQLFESNGKIWVANTTANTAKITALAEKGKKFKNSRGRKSVSPVARFYDLYSEKQILDIISSMTIHNEIPLQYGYVDGGADWWNEYATRLFNEPTSNILKRTIEMLQLNMASIDNLTKSGRKINIVDLGPGNGLPIRPLIQHFLDKGILGRYIAIDSSKEMLAILASNIDTWFGDDVQFESHVRDFSDERFDDLLADEYAGENANIPINLVCVLGGTLSNFRSPIRVLQTINSSLGLNDILIYTGYLDTPYTRRYFDFEVSTNPKHKLAPQDRLILDLLGIDESLYEPEQVFSEEKRARSISARLKVDITVTFQLSKGARAIELQKNEPILLWRYRHYNTLDILNEFANNGYNLMQVSKSEDQEFIMLIEKIKTGQ